MLCKSFSFKFCEGPITFLELTLNCFIFYHCRKQRCNVISFCFPRKNGYHTSGGALSPSSPHLLLTPPFSYIPMTLTKGSDHFSWHYWLLNENIKFLQVKGKSFRILQRSQFSVLCLFVSSWLFPFTICHLKFLSMFKFQIL